VCKSPNSSEVMGRCRFCGNSYPKNFVLSNAYKFNTDGKNVIIGCIKNLRNSGMVSCKLYHCFSADNFRERSKGAVIFSLIFKSRLKKYLQEYFYPSKKIVFSNFL
jgi:hypothetical protein